MSSAVPEGWEAGELSKFADINPRLPQKAELADDTQVSFIKMEDVSNNAVITNKRIRQYSEVSKGFTSFQDQDVLVAKITPCFENGKGGFADNLHNGVGFGSTEFHVFRAREKCSAEYIYQFTNYPNFRLEAESNMTGSAGQRRVQTDFFRTYKTAFPPLPEQQMIASILSSVDDVITKTTAQIDKLKDLKTGMMQELLTKGIGHTEFKDSPVGRIPVGWDVVNLSSITQKIADRDHTTPKYLDANEGVPIVSPTNLDENMELNLQKLKYISYEAHEKNRRKTDLQPNDIIFSRIGAGLGKSYLVKEEFWDFSILHSLCQIRVSEEIRSSYLDWFLKSDFLQRRLWLGVQSIGVPDLGLGEIGHLPVVLPANLDEQDQIVSILDGIKHRISVAIEKKRSLASLKKALMQDLLTGKVRVSVN